MFSDEVVEVITKEGHAKTDVHMFSVERLTRTTIKQLLTNDSWAGGQTMFQMGMGTPDQYRKFYGKDKQGNLVFDRLSGDPVYQYLGTQFFIGRDWSSGTNMHAASGPYNFFLMFAGVKHWLVVDPAWIPQLDCQFGDVGHYGVCLGPLRPRITIPEYVDMIRRKGLPESAWFEFTLRPGDLLVLGPAYPHAIDNKSDKFVAAAMRLMGRPNRAGVMKNHLRAYRQGFWAKLTGVKGFTVWDLALEAIMSGEKFGFLDRYWKGKNGLYHLEPE